MVTRYAIVLALLIPFSYTGRKPTNSIFPQPFILSSNRQGARYSTSKTRWSWVVYVFVLCGVISHHSRVCGRTGSRPYSDRNTGRMDGEIDAGFPRTGYVHRYQCSYLSCYPGTTGLLMCLFAGCVTPFPAPGKRITDC